MKVFINAALLVAALLVVVVTGVLADTPEVAATVNGKDITYQELVDICMRRHGPETLERLIVATAVEQAAKETGAQVTMDALEARCMNTKDQIDQHAGQTGYNFTQWLSMNDLTPDAFQESVYLTMLVEDMVSDNVKITDQQVVDYYTRNRENLRKPERVLVAHICVSDETKANELRDQIRRGEVSFEEAARANSIDPYTKDKGGEWGYVIDGEDPFQKATFLLKKDGDLSPVFNSRMGYHIVKRLKREPAAVPPFEEIQVQLRDKLEREKLMKLTEEKRVEILKGAKVETHINFGPKAPADAKTAPATDGK